MMVRRLGTGLKYDVLERYSADVRNASIEWLIYRERPAEGPSLALRYFRLEKGGYIGKHSHPWEHIIIVTRGKAILRCNEEDKVVGEGDHIYIAPNVEHEYKNKDEEPFEFYCIINCLGENCIP
jgi:quercetin dioxygenase-like cupin family protein